MKYTCAICGGTHSLGHVCPGPPSSFTEIARLQAALDEANTALARETARADQNTKAALDYAAQMERLQALPARVVAAERELAKANAENQRLRVDYRKMWAQVGPHPEPTEPGAPDDPKVLARMVLADELAERDRALAAIQRVEALCDKWASGGNWDVQIAEADIHAALAGPQNGGSE
jgi:multidrug efflux pump subunit AcrA (membrane-fusion protein)